MSLLKDLLRTTAQGSIQQSGPVTPGHAAVFMANGEVGDSDQIPEWLSSQLDEAFGSQPGTIIARNSLQWIGVPPGGTGQVLGARSGDSPSWTVLPPGLGGSIIPEPPITGSGVNLLPNTINPVKTSLGAFFGALPPLSSVLPNTLIWVVDADYAAGLNNYTVYAAVGDQIMSQGSLAPSYQLQINNQIAMFLNAGGSWTVISYGS